MKRTIVPAVLLLLFSASVALSAEKAHHFDGKGEILSVDPLYSRVTIKHTAIKGFSGDGKSEFFVTKPELLKGISTRDLVSFSLADEKGDVRIDKIERTGVAEEHGDGTIKISEAARAVIGATGEVARGITQPITPVHEGVKNATGATENISDAVLEDRKF